MNGAEPGRAYVAALLAASLRRLLPARQLIPFGAAACFAMAVITLLRIEH